MNYSDFASAEKPLHPSGIGILNTCSWRATLMHAFSPVDEGGPAGDTGSAVHKAADAWHKGASVTEALQAMGANIGKYAKADLGDASNMFLQYVADERNDRAQVKLSEHPISFSIQPHASDPTQQPIHIIGTLDQVREVDGVLRLFDIKTSKRDPISVLHESTFQMAAYCVGASVHFKRIVEPGALIMPRKYTRDASHSPVRWHYPWKFADVEHILESVRIQVANVRAGRVFHMPSDQCRWCHCKSPDICLPKLIQFRKELQRG